MTNPDHSKYCHCICNELFDLQVAIEQARAIHIKPQLSKDECLVCGTHDGKCDSCRYIHDCIACGEEWPCDTWIALDIQS